MTLKIDLFVIVLACSIYDFKTTKAEPLEPLKEEIDKVIEEDITNRLAEDLIQSLEKKYVVDLEKSVNNVMEKIQMLLQNGTTNIQDSLLELQQKMTEIRNYGPNEIERCVLPQENETAALAEKALHQMMLCGYALIGDDPSKALNKILELKHDIAAGIKPIRSKKKEIFGLLKVCGHEHDSLKKVVKCVISKSPIIKTAMIDVTGKLIDGVVDLTKLIAHGSMHEACLIEVIRAVQDEAFALVDKVQSCVLGNATIVDEEVKKYLEENNATVIESKDEIKEKKTKLPAAEDLIEMNNIIRRMLTNDELSLDKRFKKKLKMLQKDFGLEDNMV